MSKLEAIDRALLQAGLGGTNTLDTGGMSYAAVAERHFDRFSRQLLYRGWYFNIDRNVLKSPDANGHIDIASDIMRIDSYGSSGWRNVEIRNGRLYDKDDATDVFIGDIYVEQTRFVQLDDWPHEFLDHIVALTAETMAKTVPNNPSVSSAMIESLETLRLLHHADNEQSDINLVNSAHHRAMIRGQYRTPNY